MNLLLLRQPTPPAPAGGFDPDVVRRTIGQLGDSSLARLPYIVIGGIVFVLFLLVARLVKRALVAAGRRTRLDVTLADPLGRLASALATVFGLFVAAVVIPTLFIMLAAAKLAAELFERIRQPAVAGEILAGVVGPSVLGLVALTEVTNVLAEIGVIFLLFNVGLDPRRRDALRQPRADVPLGQRLVGGGGPRTLLGRGGALSVPAAGGRLTFPAVRVNASKETGAHGHVAAGC